MKSLKNISVLLLLLPVLLLAIEGFVPSTDGGFVTVGISHQNWNIESVDDPLQQTVAPIVCFYPLSSNLYLNVSNSPASASDGEISLSGLSDTWIRTTYISQNERYMFNVGVGAPTGKAELSPDEMGLVQGLSMNAFRFRLPSYGQGLSVKIGGGLALPMNNGTVLGLGINYIHKSAYRFLKDYDGEYDPGDEINIVTGLSVPVGKDGKWSTDIVYSIYSVDQVEDTDIIDAGDKVLVNTSLAYKMSSGFIYAALRFRQRGKNELFIPDGGPSVSKKTIGDQIETDGFWQFTQWPKGGLSFLWDGRFYSENEDEQGSATIFGLGLGVMHQLSSSTSGHFQIKYLTGTMHYSEDIDIGGIDVLAGIKIKFNR